MDLLGTLKAGVNNYVEINYPGTENKIRIHPLTDGEEQAAEFAAEKVFSSEGVAIAMHNIDTFELEKTVQKLYLACRTAEGEKLATTSQRFKQLISRTERDILVEEYNELLAKCSPSPSVLSEEEFNNILEEVKKKPYETTGNISSLSTLRKLAISLAVELAISQKGNGSISSQ